MLAVVSVIKSCLAWLPSDKLDSPDPRIISVRQKLESKIIRFVLPQKLE